MVTNDSASTRFRLRALRVDDADTMVSVLADPSLHQFTGGEPPSRDELARRYAVQARGISPDGTERWVNSIVLLGEAEVPIGYVQATIPVDGDTAEIAWVIGRAWQGDGHASRAARLFVEDLAHQGIRCIVAHIHPDHSASQRIASRLGMGPATVVVDGEVRWEGLVDRPQSLS